MEAKTQKSNVLTVEPRVAVVGVGGAGCNVLDDIYWADGSIDTIAINTDKESMMRTRADRKVYLCKDITKGEGAKGDTVLAERCAKAHIDEIRDALEGHDTVFVVAGMGGGTGTGVAPVVISVAHSMDLITFVIAIKPFSFETARTKVARDGISKVGAMCQMTVVVENDRVAAALPDATIDGAFRTVNASVVRYIASKKQKISEAMTDQVNAIEALIKERSEPHSLSVYAGRTSA